jgi:serine/threonine-protein kinase
VQLIDVRTGAPRWADRLEERAADLFALQDRVAQHVAATLLERVTGTERERLMSRQSRNAEAYRAYLQGRAYLFRLRRSDVERSVPLLQQAVALDPGYALAHAALANAYRVLGGNLAGGRPSRPAEMVAMARKAALEALALDDTLADAHIVLGFTKLQWEWDFPGAGASMARAVALNPNSWETHNAHGWYLLAMGRFDEAIAAFRRARELDPVMPLVAEHLGQALAFSGRVEEGLAALREAVDLDPGAPRGHARLIVLLDSLDRPEEAMAARLRAATAIGQAGDAARMQETFRHGYQAVLRQELEARVAAGECLAAAQLHMALGEPARAVDRLEACVEQRHAWMPLLRVDLRFRSLHEDPRFLALLRRIGL